MRTSTSLLTVAVLSIWLIATPVRAHLLQTCGVYDVEGYLRRSDGSVPYLVLVTDRGSKAEIRFRLSRFKAGHSKLIGTKARVQVNLRKPCTFVCDGEIVGEIQSLTPETKVRFLRPGLQPLTKLVCEK